MEKKPRLLFVTEAFGGGVFEYCLLLCNELASHFEVYLAYGVRPQTPEGFREMFDPRIHLIPVEHFVRSIRLGDDIRAGRELARIYREVKPDLVHLHSSKAGAIGRIAFAFRKTPLFYTPHGYSFLMTNAGKLRRQVYFAMEYALARIPCTTVCCSAGEYRQALRLTRRARQINNAVNLRDIDAFLRENPPARHPFTVCTVGRICQQKNPALADRIAQRMPDVRFVWVGDGELRSQLTAPNLEVTGWVKREPRGRGRQRLCLPRRGRLCPGHPPGQRPPGPGAGHEGAGKAGSGTGIQRIGDGTEIPGDVQGSAGRKRLMRETEGWCK